MRTTLLVVAAAVVIVFTAGWSWIALAYGAASYAVTQRGEAANVAIAGSYAYATLADDGFAVIDVSSGRELARIAPPLESVDDLAIAGGLLFALDARPPGHLSVFSLADPARPRLVSAPVRVDVGPFSGVSAAAGKVIVSGGTSRMSLRPYDASGTLGDVIATADFGRGQPDVLLSDDGTRAFVSTHTFGPYFGLTTVRVASAMTRAGFVSLDTYGFTPGGAKPASFPMRAALDGHVVYIADRSGLEIVDVADFDDPKILATFDPGVQGVAVDARDHVAAIAGSSPRPLLQLVDVRTPSSPRVLRSIPLPRDSQPTGVAIGATHIAVAAHRRGVLLFPR